MRFPVVLASLSLLAADAALAHPGHLAELAGHAHWVAGAAVAAAVLVGLWAGLKGRDDAAEDSDDASEEAEEEAA